MALFLKQLSNSASKGMRLSISYQEQDFNTVMFNVSFTLNMDTYTKLST